MKMTIKFDKLNETFNVDGEIVPIKSETVIEKIEKIIRTIKADLIIFNDFTNTHPYHRYVFDYYKKMDNIYFLVLLESIKTIKKPNPDINSIRFSYSITISETSKYEYFFKISYN